MYHYVMNEYVHPDRIRQDGTRWTVEYEPVEKIPIIQGSCVGSIYDGTDVFWFNTSNGRIRGSFWFNTSNGRIRGSSAVCGLVDHSVGVIIAIYDHKPDEEHYLCVSYEAGDIEKSHKVNWMQEGF